MDDKEKRELIKLIEKYGTFKEQIGRLEFKKDLNYLKDEHYRLTCIEIKDQTLSEIIEIIDNL